MYVLCVLYVCYSYVICMLNTLFCNVICICIIHNHITLLVLYIISTYDNNIHITLINKNTQQIKKMIQKIEINKK